MNITELDIRNLKKNSLILITGQRSSGKSWICRDILSYFNDFPHEIIISKTEKIDSFYSKFCKNALIYSEYKPYVIENLITRQQSNLLRKLLCFQHHES